MNTSVFVTRQNKNGHATEAQNSNEQRLDVPAMRVLARQISAPAAARSTTTTEGQRQNTKSQTPGDVTQWPAERLRDHWSLSSYSPSQSQSLVTSY